MRKWLWGDNELTTSYDKLINKVTSSIKPAANIIYTLNGYEKSEFISEILELIKSVPTYYWWLRCHPCRLEQKPKIQALLESKKIRNANVDLASNLPLYALLRHMDINITEYSSTVIECVAFGVPTVLINDEVADYYSDQISSGWAYPIKSKDEIINVINKLIISKKTDRQRENYETKEKNQALLDLINIARGSK